MSTPAGSDNPFAPPRAPLVAPPAGPGELAAEAQRVPSGRGMAWIADGWKLFTRAPGTWIGITVVFAILWILLAVIPLGSLVSSVVFPVLVGGLMLGCDDLRQGVTMPFSSLFAGFSRNAGPLLVVGLLYLVGMFAIGIVMGVGMMAMMLPSLSRGVTSFSDMMSILPGFLLVFLVALLLMLPLLMAVWFAPALIVFHDTQPTAAMRMSFQGCVRNMGPFTVYGLVGLVLSILATIPVGLGWLVLMPVVWGSMYAGYRDIFVRPA